MGRRPTAITTLRQKAISIQAKYTNGIVFGLGEETGQDLCQLCTTIIRHHEVYVRVAQTQEGHDLSSKLPPKEHPPSENHSRAGSPLESDPEIRRASSNTNTHARRDSKILRLVRKLSLW